ncbi:MAG: ATP-binding cassette domain-containing protein [Gammaproteobacteria bacterium]|nr:ATP-binding cassette domain-containing protein [Gammaproteobacteria bacterium]
MKTLLNTTLLALLLVIGSCGQDVSELEETTRLAEQGDVNGQYNLGVMYRDGDGVPQDYAEAIRWFRLAADQGDATGQYNLGVIGFSGGASGQDFEETKRLAEQGDAIAQFTLGNMYDSGRGVPENDAEAVRWYRLAAEQGGAAAQSNLGFMYENGEGVPENDAEAVKWYRLAAEQGDPFAQFNLGNMYANGNGVPENDAEAVKWYRLVAEQGYAFAQYNLGLMYANGEGVPENDVEAVRWYRLAAEQGDAFAQYNLGNKYRNGDGRWNIEEVFSMFPNLAERAEVDGGVLSGGEQQMLCMCRTLMGDPDMIMIDEPTEGLAPRIVEQVARLLQKIADRGVAILLVEQKLNIALKISHRLYVMGHGQVVYEGTTDSLMQADDVRAEWLEV